MAQENLPQNRGRTVYGLAVVTAVVLAATLSPLAAANGAQGGPGQPAGNGPQPQQVVVTNGLTAPVPVAGTLAVTQGGAWNVGIAGTPTVNVGNFPPPPVPTLWQGTPAVASVRIDAVRQDRESEFESCGPIPPPGPVGSVFFVERAIVRFEVEAGRRGSVTLTPIYSEVPPMRGFPVPTSRTASFARDGNQFEAYAGAVEIGLPMGGSSAVARACFSPHIDPPQPGGDLNSAIAEVSLIGFVIPRP